MPKSYKKILYIPQVHAPVNAQLLDTYHITHFVNLEWNHSHPDTDKIKQISRGYCCDIGTFAYDFIEKAFEGDANILVYHPYETKWIGVAILTYLVKKYGMTVAAARDYLNAGFGQKIPIYQETLDELKKLEGAGIKSTKIPSDLAILPYV